MAESKRSRDKSRGSKKQPKTSKRETLTDLSRQRDSARSSRSSQRTARKDTGASGSSTRGRYAGGKTSGQETERRKENREAAPEEYTMCDPLHQLIAALIMLAVGIFFVLSLHTSMVGAAGAAVARAACGMFGLGGYFLAYLLILYAILILLEKTAPFKKSTIVLLLITFLMIDIINAGRFMDGYRFAAMDPASVFSDGAALRGGGVFGMYAGYLLHRFTGQVGLYLIAAVVIVICLLFLMHTGVSRFFDRRAARKEHDRQVAVSRERYKDASRFSDALRRRRREEEETMVLSLPEEDSAPSPTSRKEGSDRQNDTKQKNHQHKIRKQSLFDWDRKEAHRAQDQSAQDRKKLSASENPGLNNIIQLVKTEDHLGRNADGCGITDFRSDGHGRHEPVVYGLCTQDPFAASSGEDAAQIQTDKSALSVPPASEDTGADSQARKKDAAQTTAAGASSDLEHRASSAMAGPQLGGASSATAVSETESSEGEVSDTPKKRRPYHLPPASLLNRPKSDGSATESAAALREKAQVLEQTLASFHVDARVVNIISGPSVTRYELEPARGVKVQRITSLADDIALNMRARSIRIEAPIPGKAAVGIEVENESRQMVGFREIVDSSEFKNHRSKLAFTVGRDIGGKPVVADLAKMPHMLIAGATGSGKSVCINTIICSILYKARPEEVRMVLIDPKMVELGNYNGIPHLLVPVVTDAAKAAAALNWAVSEMKERYTKFAKTHVRKIAEYNKLMREHGEKDEILPQIVIIIDELADLMMVASSQVEDSICRLAQLARAAGMHLVIATQRPSVDVITGLIKANVPSRIAFTVSSQIDSRTIIDMPGAEKLVGNGDMLFRPQDLNKPKRIQGPYIDDNEIQRIIDFVKDQGAGAEYSQTVLEQIEQGGSYEHDSEEDQLMDDAVDTVIRAGQASVSMLQRHFRIGYNRAARIVDAMEAQGIVGPQDGSRPRQVLISREEYERRRENA